MANVGPLTESLSGYVTLRQLTLRYTTLRFVKVRQLVTSRYAKEMCART